MITEDAEDEQVRRQQAAERLQQMLERTGEQAVAAGLDEEGLSRLLADES